jgi:hypothetical protein
MKKAFWLSIACLLSLWAAQAQASPITTLYNTGVDASHAVLADGTIGDPHYTLTSVPSGTTALRISTSASGFPIPPWVGDNASSRWIGPNNSSNMIGPPGGYTYATTFSLAGFNSSTASVAGNWSSDNAGVNIFINGTPLGFSTTPGAFTAFHPFTINSGFVGGVNTLAFVVNNGNGGPPPHFNATGLRVEMTGTATATAVPEPDSLLLLLLGTGLLGVAAWRLKKSA